MFKLKIELERSQASSFFTIACYSVPHPDIKGEQNLEYSSPMVSLIFTPILSLMSSISTQARSSSPNSESAEKWKRKYEEQCALTKEAERGAPSKAISYVLY